jgi:hypothetical protein
MVGSVPPGSGVLGLEIQRKGKKRMSKWSRNWNEDKQSAKSKAVFPFIAEPHDQAS